MRLLVNTLSATSLSGAHVIFGHLEQLSRQAAKEHEYLVLHHPDDQKPDRDFADNVAWVVAPPGLRHWMRRAAWESLVLPAKLRRWGIDLLFTPAGATIPRCPVPQICLAQNPWCLVRGIQRGLAARFKAAVQRRAYRRAMREAVVMIYNSHHMRRLYQQNAPGVEERRFQVVYQAVDEDTFDAARRLVNRNVTHPGRILAVSVMAAWKGIETVVQALSLLRQRGVDAHLRLVGPWPDARYERAIRRQVAELRLGEVVAITGRVSRQQLHEEYAAARVFCLMSYCESFGIPALEAQAFGTPVVGSDVCAMPEICGQGGCYGPPGEAAFVAQSLEQLLTDEAAWQRRSKLAMQNADRFQWGRVSQPLIELLRTVTRDR